MTVAKLPIVNYVNGAPMGDFCAEIEIGDGNTAFVILDTGSSTLAVWESAFGDAKTNATDCVQFVSYGTGHWAGPVKEAAVSLGGVEVSNGVIAQIQSGMYRGRKQFYPADGILGLAYFTLNTAADVGQQDFPLSQYDSPQEWTALLQKPNVQEKHLPPFFTQIEKQG
ncbi:MAG: pepsin-like aspartyl protease, partial [Pseudomonadota bacterium]